MITILLQYVYGFRVEGAESLPKRGPFILVHNELSHIAFLMTGWIDILALGQAFDRTPDTMTFLREERMSLPFFRKVLNDKTPGRYAALKPINAGRLALGLLEAYHVLQNDGIVVLYPEGDMPWDGRPLPLGHALAWLGLHTAAPIVPALATIGAYDIWPRWQSRMSLHGQMRLIIGEAFTLSDAPRARVTDADLAGAEREMRARFEEQCYGTGGIGEWTGAPTMKGNRLDQQFRNPVDQAVPIHPVSAFRHVPLSKRGLALLLWRCPICRVNDALIHYKPIVGGQILQCQACGTRWNVRHIPGKDFRLEVAEGPKELQGLEMALSVWYDEMKRNLVPTPFQASNVDLEADEQVFLEAQNVSLAAETSGQQLVGLTNSSSEAPQVMARTMEPQRKPQSIERGRLILTNERLIWQSPRAQIYFRWSRITSITLWLLTSLTIRYGTATFNFELNEENGLKWLAYAALQAERAAALTGRKINLSRF